jgi:uncharacterized membrane protein YpjA
MIFILRMRLTIVAIPFSFRLEDDAREVLRFLPSEPLIKIRTIGIWTACCAVIGKVTNHEVVPQKFIINFEHGRNAVDAAKFLIPIQSSVCRWALLAVRMEIG